VPTANPSALIKLYNSPFLKVKYTGETSQRKNWQIPPTAQPLKFLYDLVELIRLQKHNRNPPRAGKILRNKLGNEHKTSRERKREAYHFDSKKSAFYIPSPPITLT
jgi:hypothetical protein